MHSTLPNRISSLAIALLLIGPAGLFACGGDGDTGPDGADGSPGADGADGTGNGTDGTDGADGADGAPGNDGADGLDLTDPVPIDMPFAFAVTNNSGGTHNGVNVLTLDFDGATANATTVVSTFVEAPPVLNGTDDGLAVWGGFESTVALTPQSGADNGISSVTMRSVYTTDDIYFYAEWTETANVAMDATRKEWTYDLATTSWAQSGNEDRAYWAFPIDDADFAANNGCTKACHGGLMYTDPGDIWDVWHWKAARTGPTGTLDDKWWDENDRNSDYGMSAYMEPTNGALPQFMHINDVNANAAYPVWIWDMVPFTAGAWADGATIPGVINRLPTGSRGDVAAVGKWDTDTWILEVKRARNTGNGDDVIF